MVLRWNCFLLLAELYYRTVWTRGGVGGGEGLEFVPDPCAVNLIWQIKDTIAYLNIPMVKSHALYQDGRDDR